MGVKRLIRDKGTQHFFKAGSWTPEAQAAQKFLTAQAARDAQAEFKLKDVELYYLFGDAPSKTYDWTIPLP